MLRLSFVFPHARDMRRRANLHIHCAASFCWLGHAQATTLTKPNVAKLASCYCPRLCVTLGIFASSQNKLPIEHAQASGRGLVEDVLRGLIHLPTLVRLLPAASPEVNRLAFRIQAETVLILELVVHQVEVPRLVICNRWNNLLCRAVLHDRCSSWL